MPVAVRQRRDFLCEGHLQRLRGQVDFGTKAWDAVSKEALLKIVEEAFRRGFPLSGNFNFDGELTNWLGQRGASISEDGSEYRWSIVKGQAPAVVLTDNSAGHE